MHRLEEHLLRGRQAESPPVFSLRFCAPAPYGKNREAAARSVTREGFNGQCPSQRALSADQRVRTVRLRISTSKTELRFVFNI